MNRFKTIKTGSREYSPNIAIPEKPERR